MKYTCKKCGEIHEEWPAYGFVSPTSYNCLTPSEQDQMAELNRDYCIIRYPKQTDRFVRCALFQKVSDHCVQLEYGLWVALNEYSFVQYRKNYGTANAETKYFGWLSNDLPEYTFDEMVPVTIHCKKGNEKPEIVPHQSYSHAFVYDYYNGISSEEAEARIQAMMAATEGSRKRNHSVKPWWKVW